MNSSSEGKKALATAYADAEVVIVFLFGDTDQDSTPDNWSGSTGYYTANGAGFGSGKTSITFFHNYCINADNYIKTIFATPT